MSDLTSARRSFKASMDQLDRLDKLEIAFKESVAKLPNYKRGAAWEYVKELQEMLRLKDIEIQTLSDQI